jgi:hypothetical protein
MRSLAAGLRLVLLLAVLVGGVSALIGFLVAHFGRLGSAGSGAGWGMCIGGAVMTLVVGQSGSTGRMAAEGRWGPFGQYWGGNRSLPQSPLWTILSAVLVLAAGIAVIVLTY